MKRMMFMKRMIAMMAMAFSVAMFAACSDDNEDDGGNGGNEGTVVEATGVTLDQTTLSVAPGESMTLIATVAPENATDKSVTWASSDEAVATVDSAGVVTGVADGTATITVTTTSGGFSATCEVTVTAPVPHVGDIYYSDGTFSTSLNEGKTPIGIIFHVFPEGATVEDPSLAALFPEGLNGLVVSLDDFPRSIWSNYFVGYANSRSYEENFYNKMLPYAAADFDNTIFDTEKMVGYNNTLISQAFDEFAPNSGWIYEEKGVWDEESQSQIDIQHEVRIELMDSLALYNERVAVPETASSWYVPSYAELNQIIVNLEAVNTALESLERTVISGEYNPSVNSHILLSSTMVESYEVPAYPPFTEYNTYAYFYNLEESNNTFVVNRLDSYSNVRYVLAF